MPCMCCSARSAYREHVDSLDDEFHEAISSCLNSDQGSLLNRALHRSLTNRIFLSITGLGVHSSVLRRKVGKFHSMRSGHFHCRGRLLSIESCVLCN